VRNGIFVTFEGIDGSGKSTQARLVHAALAGAGLDVILTREPGGSPGAEEIRSLLVSGEGDRWSPETELILFNAARRDHVERTIRPALERGAIVLCDRYVDSTRGYQGGDPDRARLIDLMHQELIGLDPDLTILIDVDPSVASARDGAQKGAETRFESFGNPFMSGVADRLRDRALREPDRFVCLDGTTPRDVLAGHITAVILDRLGVDGPNAVFRPNLM
jgi:dTMP kinase